MISIVTGMLMSDQPQVIKQWVIITCDDRGHYVIGPFNSWEEANGYRIDNYVIGSYNIHELITPPKIK